MASFRHQPGMGFCSDTSLKPQLRNSYWKSNADLSSRAFHPRFLRAHLTNAHDRQPYVVAQLALCTHEKRTREQRS